MWSENLASDQTTKKTQLPYDFNVHVMLKYDFIEGWYWLLLNVMSLEARICPEIVPVATF